MTRSVQEAIRAAVDPGMRMRTPARNKPFRIDRVDSDGIVLLLGAGEWPTRITWACFEGIVPFIREHGGEVPIGGRHDVDGNPGTLDEWMKGCVKRTTAGWVAVVLKTAGVIEIIGGRPQRVRLLPPWR